MTFNPIFEYSCPTRIIHGLGCVARLGAEVKALGGQRVLIVTDPGIVRAGLLVPVTKALESSDLSHLLFDSVGHDAQVGAVDRGAQLCRDEKVEVVVAIGGGSALAAGKAVAAIAANGGSLGDHQGPAKLAVPPLPVIAIPTTAGSGSEVSAAIPYFDETRGRKTGTQSHHFFPQVALLDATLLASLPFRQAVLSGVDALTHAMEAYLTVQATPITDALALAAIRMLAGNLRAAATTTDLAAQEQALLGSTMANLACGNAKLGLVHLLNRPVNSLYPAIPYGQSIGTLLLPVMAFNLPASVDRFAAMAQAMGEQSGQGTTRELAQRCLGALKQLLVDLRMERRYPPDIVDAKTIPQMARMCVEGMHGGMQAGDVPDTALVKSFNRRQAAVADVVRLYEQAFEGWEV
ncbi:MAG: iron-containing alcohol dehydrogenase [Anaerolineae bacterium]